jgi:hypothetical protein
MDTVKEMEYTKGYDASDWAWLARDKADLASAAPYRSCPFGYKSL